MSPCSISTNLLRARYCRRESLFKFVAIVADKRFCLLRAGREGLDSFPPLMLNSPRHVFTLTCVARCIPAPCHGQCKAHSSRILCSLSNISDIYLMASSNHALIGMMLQDNFRVCYDISGLVKRPLRAPIRIRVLEQRNNFSC